MIVQAIVSVGLLAVFLVLAAFNDWIAWQTLRGRHVPSMAVLFGGLAGAAGLAIWPYHDLGLWTLAPLLLDAGCAPYLSVFVFLETRRAWRDRGKN